MKFKRLRVAGFKTFVDPTDFLIEPGLTGIVGPNGCGKSNLVEALRWVMGENSYKSMRGSGMDDVIFSGGGSRPGRNTAEVTLVLDNADRLAPAGFNDSDSLEITRRIEREAGSTYRINGREVRARDVQMLFADASTGARSPAMVRQGQISEIIAARPQARRRVLEEAAGIAGLHSRRHEAELRLKAADENALRVEDVLRQIEGQVEGLKRQARQTARYRAIAADLRRAEALVLLIQFRAIEREWGEARQKLDADTRDVAERTRLQAETARLAGLAVHALPALREAEARAGAAHQRLVLALEALDGEERRARHRGRELFERIRQLEEALAREAVLIADADAVLEKLDAEDFSLADETAFSAVAQDAMRLRLADSENALGRSEAALQVAQAAFSESAARRTSFENSRDDANRRIARLDAERETIVAESTHLRAQLAEEADVEIASADLEDATYAASEAEERLLLAEDRHGAARDAEAATRAPLQAAERLAERRDTEFETLRKLLGAGSAAQYPPALDRITVAKGYEAALGAALGEDLDVALDPAAPAHWAAVDRSNADPDLPDGAIPLKTFVRAPEPLRRRLAQIGLVDRAQGTLLRARLKPGQRLVSREGDFWRWDGLTVTADAPSPVARRLAERNRLDDLAQGAEAARAALAVVRQMAEHGQTELRAAAANEAEMRTAARAAGRALEEARLSANAAERARALILSRRAALQEAQARLDASRDDAFVTRDEMVTALAALKTDADLGKSLDAARLAAARDRTVAADLRAAAQNLTKETDRRQRRRQAIGSERLSWTERRMRAQVQADLAKTRLAEARADHAALDEAPEEFSRQREALKKSIATAEGERGRAVDRRKEAEAAANLADGNARTALDDMARVREARASSQARVDAMAQRRADIVHLIEGEMNCPPAGLPAIAGMQADTRLPDGLAAEQTVESLRRDRERLGSVNLRAEEELAEVEKTRDGLLAEHADLTEAVKRLRQAILNLNREGRERLLAAFDVVNGHFKTLFATLFGGGAAELQWIESDDPLEGGLEILARPPGKRPTTMTLLSGGEQALTALSLIFAVFLTNPSPICVLDEVDAPLDDSNVERLCDLLDEMARRTDTRFMTITHNPITMARMDRLFGVTMAERGISQLVSVDLQTAEQFREAG